MNCHKKCEKLTANLCGINQKLIVEALSSVRRGKIFSIASLESRSFCDTFSQEIFQATFGLASNANKRKCLINDNDVALVGSKRDSNYNEMPTFKYAASYWCGLWVCAKCDKIQCDGVCVLLPDVNPQTNTPAFLNAQQSHGAVVTVSCVCCPRVSASVT